MASFRDSGHAPTTTQMLGLAALQYAPSPMLVLSGSTKQIIFCNYAMERLFHSVREHAEKGLEKSSTSRPAVTSESVQGKGLSEVGIGLLQEGSAVYIEFGWTRLLDALRPRDPSKLMKHSDQQTVRLHQTAYLKDADDFSEGAKVKDANIAVVLSSPKPDADISASVEEAVASVEPFSFTPVLSSPATPRFEGKATVTPFDTNGLSYFLFTFINVKPVSLPISRPTTARSTTVPTSTLGKLADDKVEHASSPSDTIYASFEDDELMQLTVIQKIAIMKNAFLDTMEVPVFATWLDGSCTFANKAGMHWAAQETPISGDIGFLDDNWASKFSVWDSEFKEELPITEYPLMRICRDRIPLSSQKVGMINKKGTRKVFDVAGEGIIGKNGEWIAGLIWLRDVTQIQKEYATQLAKQAKENARLVAKELSAKEASRLKSQFLANMSHEIRTPIAGVLGMSEILLDTKLSEEQQEYAENVQRSANALLTVINDILDFSKVESGRLDIEEVQFSLSLVLSDVIKMMEIHAEKKRLHFVTDIQGIIQYDLQVLGDPGRIRQILTNLLSNSIKFTADGFVKITALTEEELHVDRNTSQLVPKGATGAEKYVIVKFEVEDTGIGIKDDVMKLLFKPFGQADSSTARKFGGSGLGLAISKNLVDLMGGIIELKSEYGKGTKALVKIPFRYPATRMTNSTNGVLPDIGSVPERLQNDASVSLRSVSEASTSPRIVPIGDITTPPISPLLRESARQDRNHVGNPANNASRGAPEDLNFRTRSRSTASAQALPIHVQIQGDPKIVLPMEKRHRMHILVVEDNPINQQIALKLVKKLGFNVSAVWNGKEALDYLIEANIQFPEDADQAKIPENTASYSASIQQHVREKLEEEDDPEPLPQPDSQDDVKHPNDAKMSGNIIPDLILMDCHMPIMDGYSATRALRLLPEPLRTIPIVAMTASAIKGDREKCKEAGMSDYLSKPVVTVNLEKMLAKWLSYHGGDDYKSIKMTGQTPPTENSKGERTKFRLPDMSKETDRASSKDRISIDDQLEFARKKGMTVEKAERDEEQ